MQACTLCLGLPACLHGVLGDVKEHVLQWPSTPCHWYGVCAHCPVGRPGSQGAQLARLSCMQEVGDVEVYHIQRCLQLMAGPVAHVPHAPGVWDGRCDDLILHNMTTNEFGYCTTQKATAGRRAVTNARRSHTTAARLLESAKSHFENALCLQTPGVSSCGHNCTG